jgi:hypothetical protein
MTIDISAICSSQWHLRPVDDGTRQAAPSRIVLDHYPDPSGIPP